MLHRDKNSYWKIGLKMRLIGNAIQIFFWKGKACSPKVGNFWRSLALAEKP
jgi:hypothetical protein